MNMLKNSIIKERAAILSLILLLIGVMLLTACSSKEAAVPKAGVYQRKSGTYFTSLTINDEYCVLNESQSGSFFGGYKYEIKDEYLVIGESTGFLIVDSETLRYVQGESEDLTKGLLPDGAEFYLSGK